MNLAQSSGFAAVHAGWAAFSRTRPASRLTFVQWTVSAGILQVFA